MMLLKSAKSSIKIASAYWSLRGADVPDMGTNTSWQGEQVFQGIYDAGKNRGIKIQIAQSKPTRSQRNEDTQLLAQSKSV